MIIIYIFIGIVFFIAFLIGLHVFNNWRRWRLIKRKKK